MKLLWLDLETTGLDPARQTILELGMIVTDGQLNELGRFCEPVFCSAPKETWEPEAWDMHMNSGSGVGQRSAESSFDRLQVQVLARHFLLKYLKGEKGVLAGNSVHFDREWLKSHMPELLRFVGHRQLDVSTFKVLGEMYGWPKQKHPSAHTALEDLDAAIAHLKEVSRRFRFQLPPIGEDA